MNLNIQEYEAIRFKFSESRNMQLYLYVYKQSCKQRYVTVIFVIWILYIVFKIKRKSCIASGSAQLTLAPNTSTPTHLWKILCPPYLQEHECVKIFTNCWSISNETTFSPILQNNSYANNSVTTAVPLQNCIGKY
jgi:hypothetical protein